MLSWHFGGAGDQACITPGPSASSDSVGLINFSKELHQYCNLFFVYSEDWFYSFFRLAELNVGIL